MNFLFGFSGRIGRGSWWLGQLIVIIVGVATLVIIFKSLPRNLPRSAFESGEIFSLMSGSAILALACLFMLAMWINIAVTIKRYHDRGKPGVWFLMMFVPYIGSIWILVECGFLRGASGPNGYDSPDDRFDHDFGRAGAYRQPADRMTQRNANDYGQAAQSSRRPTGPTGFGKRAR